MNSDEEDQQQQPAKPIKKTKHQLCCYYCQEKIGVVPHRLEKHHNNCYHFWKYMNDIQQHIKLSDDLVPTD